jgi:hypothetical protein
MVLYEKVLETALTTQQRGLMPPFLSAVLFTAILGLLVPSILIRSGYPPVLAIAFAIALLAFVIDGLVTRFGLSQRAINEANPILNFLIGKMKTNAAILATRVLGAAILLYGLLALENAYFLFAVGLGYLMVVLLSMIAIQFSSINL